MRTRLDIVLRPSEIVWNDTTGLAVDGSAVSIRFSDIPQLMPLQLAKAVATSLQLDVSDLQSVLPAHTGSHFEFEIGSVHTDFCLVASTGIGLLRVTAGERVLAEKATDFLMAVDAVYPVLQAGIIDPDYDLWQNTDSILVYEANDRVHAHLPKRSNDMPFPLTEEIIDTSQNPGRRVLRRNYVEFVANPFWIREDWRSHHSADVGSGAAAAWTAAAESPFLKFSCGPGPFRTADYRQGHLQDLLRNYLYGHLDHF